MRDPFGWPVLASRREDGRELPLLVWRCPEVVRAASTGPLGGGIGERRWVVNASVPAAYSRMDPDRHLAELADGLALDGAGVGLLTAVDVATAVHADDGGVRVVVTVGLGHPTWAAAADGHLRDARTAGTINIVCWLPVRLSDAALLNAVVTATEAKAQALWDGGVGATGTASDAVVVACPAGGGDGDEPYCGPRSRWGARLARAVHSAVLTGAGAGAGGMSRA